MSLPGLDQSVSPGGMKESPAGQQRYASIDLMRGSVMVLMVLDHTRDFLGSSSFDPRNVSDLFLFLTRWVTHFCAPVFMLLAGASAWFALQKYDKRWDATRYLFLRGIWLIVLELTVVRFAWTFQFASNFIILQVLWVLGLGMIFLSLLVHLPPTLVGVIGSVIILTHNLVDPIQAANLGPLSWLWSLLHEPHLFQHDSGRQVWALYPLIPWFGVMAFGFGFAPNLVPHARSSGFFYAWGTSLIGLFVLLRFTGLYGDPHLWQPQSTFLASLLSFVNCEKYPPSLQFLLMTLGPVLAVYPLLSSIRGKAAMVLLTFGKVPLFFYVLQILLIHGVAVLVEALNRHSMSWLFGDFPLLKKPVGYGMPLPHIYLFWLVILFVLYITCHRYGSVKLSSRRWWTRLL